GPPRRIMAHGNPGRAPFTGFSGRRGRAGAGGEGDTGGGRGRRHRGRPGHPEPGAAPKRGCETTPPPDHARRRAPWVPSAGRRHPPRHRYRRTAVSIDIDTLVRRSARLEVEDLDLGAFRAQPLDPDTLRCLRYMHDVEGHTV